MMYSHNSSLFPTQLLENLLVVLQGLVHCGQAPAAARLTYAVFPSQNPLAPTHVCPLSFPPPTPPSSPSKRRRRQKRRKSKSPAVHATPRSNQLVALEAPLPPTQLRRRDRDATNQFYIKSMSATIAQLAVSYSPTKYFPRARTTDQQRGEVIANKVEEGEVMINKRVEQEVVAITAEQDVIVYGDKEEAIIVKVKEEAIVVKVEEEAFVDKVEHGVVAEEEKAEAKGGEEEKLEEESAGIEQAMELVGMHAVSTMAPTTPCFSQPGFSWSSSPPRHMGEVIIKVEQEVFDNKVEGGEVMVNKGEQEVIANTAEQDVIVNGDKEESIVVKVEEEAIVTKIEEETFVNKVEQEWMRSTVKKEEVISCPEPATFPLGSVQPKGGFVSGTMPTPLPARPAPLPIDQGGVEVISNDTKGDEVEEVMIIKEDVELLTKQAEKDVVAKQDVDDEEEEEKEGVINMRTWEEHCEGKEIEELHFSVEDLQLDANTGQVSHHGQPVVFASAQLRERVLAKLSSTSPAPILPSGLALPTGAEPSPAFLNPLHPRHQERRLTFGHLKCTSELMSLGRQTRWTKQLLLSELEAAFSKRGGYSWSDFSPEEKLACFDMVDWAVSCPNDPPSRSLMFEPDQDQWSNWT